MVTFNAEMWKMLVILRYLKNIPASKNRFMINVITELGQFRSKILENGNAIYTFILFYTWKIEKNICSY